MGDFGGVLLAVVLLAFNAFFVGAEFALLSARRSQIEPRAQEGSRSARTALRAMEHVSLVMAGAQLGITVCSLGLGAVGEPAVAHLLEPVFHALHVPDAALHPLSFVVAMSIVVYLHVVLGEMVPKNIALAGPDRAALVLSPPMMVIVTLLRPIISVLNLTANGILRLLGIEPKDEVSSSYTREEVAALVEESRGEGMIAADEYDRLAGALGFTEKVVTAVLMPVEGLSTVLSGSTPGRRRGAVRRHRLQQVPGHRPPTARCWATCTSRTSWRATRSVASAPSTTSGFVRSRPSAPTTSCTRRWRACSAAGAHMARVVTREGAVLGAGHPRGRAGGAGRRDPRRLAPRVGRKPGRCWIG